MVLRRDLVRSAGRSSPDREEAHPGGEGPSERKPERIRCDPATPPWPFSGLATGRFSSCTSPFDGRRHPPRRVSTLKPPPGQRRNSPGQISGVPLHRMWMRSHPGDGWGGVNLTIHACRHRRSGKDLVYRKDSNALHHRVQAPSGSRPLYNVPDRRVLLMAAQALRGSKRA